MKTYKIFGLIAAMILTFVSCETEIEDPAGPRDKGVSPLISDLNPAVFDSNDLENTFIKFTLDVPSPATEATVLVSYNGDGSRAEMANLNTFPANITINLTDIVDVMSMTLGDIVIGDYFTVEITTVIDGKTYYSNAAFIAPVVCAYNVSFITGSYHAVSAGWGLDGNVTISVDPEDDYKLYVTGLAAIEGLDEDQGPLVMEVNPLNYKITTPKSVLASNVEPWGLPYTGYYYEGSGVLNTCDGSYAMAFTIGVDQGTWGSYDFTFTKN
jgi:hypothetical protein